MARSRAESKGRGAARRALTVLIGCGASALVAAPSSGQPWPEGKPQDQGGPRFDPFQKTPVELAVEEAQKAAQAEPRFQTLAWSPDGEVAVGCEFAQPGFGAGGQQEAAKKSAIVLWQVASGREIRRFGDYDGEVEQASFSPDGKMLATVGLVSVEPKAGEFADRAVIGVGGDRRFLNSVQVWDVSTGRRLSTLKRPQERINWASGLSSAMFLPDNTLLTWGMYNFLPPRQWDARTGELKRALPEMPERPTMMIRAVAASPGGRLLAIGGSVSQWAFKNRIKREVGRVYIYDLQSGQLIQKLGESLPKDPPLTENSPNMWDFPAGPEDSEMGDQLSSLAFSPDGKRLATGGVTGAPETTNAGSGRFQQGRGVVQIWDVASGKGERSWPANQEAVTQLSFSPDGHRLAGADRDNVVSIWDVQSGKSLHQWSVNGRQLSRQTVETKPGPKGHRIKVTLTQAIGAGGGTSANSDGSTLPDPEQEGETVITRIVEEKTELGVRQFDWARDGTQLLALNLSRSVVKWNLKHPPPNEAAPKYLPSGGNSRMHAFAFSPDGRFVASGGHDKKIRLWDAARREQVLAWPAHSESVAALAWTPDGSTIVSAGPILKWTYTDVPGMPGAKTGRADQMGSELRVWDRATGKVRRVWTVPQDDILSLAVSPDGKRLYSAGNVIGDMGAAQVQNGAGGVAVGVQAVGGQPAPKQDLHGAVRWWNLEAALKSEGQVAPERTEGVSGARVTTLAISPDGKMLATDHEEQGLRLWDAESGELKYAMDTPEPLPLGTTAATVRFGQPDSTQRLVFSADGQRVLRASGKDIQTWRADTGAREADIAPASEPRSFTLSPDGRLLVVSTPTGLALWDVASGQVRPWPGGAPNMDKVGGVPQQLAFAPDGATLAGASGGAIQLWNMPAK